MCESNTLGDNAIPLKFITQTCTTQIWAVVVFFFFFSCLLTENKQHAHSVICSILVCDKWPHLESEKGAESICKQPVAFFSIYYKHINLDPCECIRCNLCYGITPNDAGLMLSLACCQLTDPSSLKPNHWCNMWLYCFSTITQTVLGNVEVILIWCVMNNQIYAHVVEIKLYWPEMQTTRSQYFWF